MGDKEIIIQVRNLRRLTNVSTETTSFDNNVLYRGNCGVLMTK